MDRKGGTTHRKETTAVLNTAPRTVSFLSFLKPCAPTMDHLRGHPVGVSYNSVALPAVRPAELWQWPLGRPLHRRCFALIPLLHHQPGQAKICHHHRLVLIKQIMWETFNEWGMLCCFQMEDTEWAVSDEMCDVLHNGFSCNMELDTQFFNFCWLILT